MKIIEKIKEPIAKEFEIFESEFIKSVNSGILVLNVILKFMINRKGKQVRPILVLLFAKMYSSENLTEKSYRSAIISELIQLIMLEMIITGRMLNIFLIIIIQMKYYYLQFHLNL